MTSIETVGTYEHCGPDGSCFRPKGHDGGCVPRPILPEGILMPSVLRGPIPALPVTIPTPQEAQERPKTAGTGSGRGTGIAETQNSRQAREEWGVRRRDGRVLSFEDRDDAEAFADGWHGGERTVVHRFIGPWELAPSLPVPSTEASDEH